MELPFLKNKNNGGGSGDPTHRISDHSNHQRLLQIVAEELLAAFEKKDRGAFLEALHAFCSLIQTEDEEQDVIKPTDA